MQDNTTTRDYYVPNNISGEVENKIVEIKLDDILASASSTTVEQKVYMITPEIAESLMKLNVNNRKIRQEVVITYSGLMRRGLWDIKLGEPLRFSNAGRLVDGQHRLQAVIMSGCTVPFIVEGNFDEALRAMLNSGVARSRNDILKMAGVKNPPAVTSTLFHLGRLLGYSTTTESVRLAKIEFEKLGILLGEDISAAYSEILAMCESGGVPLRSIYTSVYFVLVREYGKEKVNEVFQKILCGYGLTADSKEVKIRNKYVMPKIRKHRDSGTVSIDVFFAAVLGLLQKNVHNKTWGDKFRVHFSEEVLSLCETGFSLSKNEKAIAKVMSKKLNKNKKK